MLYSTFLLALALQFLRSNGISHMDLKPQNLLLSSPMKPVLKIGGLFFFSIERQIIFRNFKILLHITNMKIPHADFGMAQLMRAEDHAKSFRGSPLYMV